MSAQAIRLNCLFNKRSSRWLDGWVSSTFWYVILVPVLTFVHTNTLPCRIKARGATPSAEMLLRGLSRASNCCVPRGLLARGMTAMPWPVRDLPRRRCFINHAVNISASRLAQMVRLLPADRS